MVVVGAGPAGLAASSRLARGGCHHVVLERGRIGSTWRTQRWESFRLNTPQWGNLVPGEFLDGRPDSFATAESLVAGLERFAHGLPVFEGVEVFRAEKSGPVWRLDTSHGQLVAGAVVVASGFQNIPRRPDYADALPAEIEQLHAADFRRPGDLEGSVLVVGGGQSGVQIAEDLLDHGHDVYLSTSRVGRLPRRHRGRDAFEWLRDTGQLDLPTHQAEPAMITATPPQVSGSARGRSISYQGLANRGATLLGRALGWNGRRLELAPDLGANVKFADGVSQSFRAAWDALAAARGDGDLDAHRDPADEPAEDLHHVRGPDSLDLGAAGISSVIWATGFGPSTGWLPKNALDVAGHPRLSALHVIGAPWLTHRSSANLYGMVADAERLASMYSGAALAA
ncbi:MAG TPA: NAD(P)/FAD-dependent oxidoreductase [Gaiellaceae bacterium]